jgi:hypothetical protein
MKYKTLSNRVKATATKLHACIIATAEYTKMLPGTIPHNGNIAETRALIYDANLIIHIYNDLHERGGQAVCFHEHESQRLPRIRFGIGKNKITEFKDRLFFDFYPASGLFRYVPVSVAEEDMKQRTYENRNRRSPTHTISVNENSSIESDGDQPEMPQ